MRRSNCIIVLAFIASFSLAQVKSIQGSAGKLVTGHETQPSGPNHPRGDTLTNSDIIDLVAIGLGDDLVIDKIRSSSHTNFDTSVAGLKSLKAARVSDAVIRVMMNPHAVPDAPAAVAANAAAANDLPKEVGVYVMVRGNLKEIEPEIVGWQTGGVLKTLATVGFDRGHVNGKIMRSHSPLQVANPIEFIIRTPEGTSATEYQLLQLYVKGNRREFRAITGGILHASGGAERTALPFKPEKIGDRTWKIQLQNIERGEYGFLPPGISSASISASGKMYTFGVKE